ncbi:MAG: hypothetical protein HY017_31945 [Betaproteobacteria bacterium]|nr:hypothetical protein [Betaproteobacteria bacterium]
MRRLAVALAVGAALTLGSFAAHSKLPAPPAKSDAEKTAEAEKTKLAAAKEGELLGKYQDSAVANYKKNKGIADKPAAKAAAKKK